MSLPKPWKLDNLIKLLDMELNAVLAIFTLISGDMFDQIRYFIIVNLMTTSHVE